MAPAMEASHLAQFSFAWWNGAVPLLAIFALLGLSRVRFGVSAEELRAIVEAQGKAPPPNLAAAARQLAQRARNVGAPRRRPHRRPRSA